MTTLLQRAQPISRWLQKLPHAQVIGASLLLAALLVAFFWRAALLGESLLPNDLIYELDPVWQNHAPPGFVAPGNRLLSDTVYFFYPWQVEMQRAILERRIPLWTPYINNGQPMLGNGQVGVWDPFWVIARLFPFRTTFLVASMLKLWVSGLFTFLLARQLGIGCRGAVLAMVTFAFSGPMLAWLGYTVAGVAAWLPLLLYLSERALSKQSTSLFLVIGIVLACQFLSGHPETSFHLLLTWAVFCLARTVTRAGWRVRALARLFCKMTLALAIGLALAAAQILPLAEGILNSMILIKRQANVSVSLLQTTFLEWRNWPTLITTVLPQFFGTPMDNSYWYPYQNYNEQTFYAGVAPVALGLMTLLVWWQGRRDKSIGDGSKEARGFSPGFWIGLTLLALGIAAQLPVLNAINALPILQLVNHGRMRIVYALGLALLAGYGLDVLAQAHLRQLDAPKKLLIVLGALAILNLIAVGGAYVGVTTLRDQFIKIGQDQAKAMKAMDHPLFPYPLEYYYTRVNVRYVQTRRLYTLATPEMFLPVGIALVVGLLEWSRRRGWNQALWLNGLVALTCVDLFAFGIRLNPTIKPEQSFPPTGAVQFLKQQPGLYRVSGLYLALMPNSGMVFGLSDVRGYDAVVPWRQATLLQSLDGAFRLNHYALLRSADSRLLDLMNVEYMVADRELGGRWKLVFADPDSPVRVYRNPDVMPRAFIVCQSERAESAEAALNRLLDKNFDFRTRVILEKAASDPPAFSGASAPLAQARIVTYEPERVVVETDSPAEGILVLTDTHVPGWRAQVDGQPADIYLADYAFRAVRIPAGRRRVEFVYAPPSFVIGSAISLAALACCALWAVVIIYRKARCEFSIT